MREIEFRGKAILYCGFIEKGEWFYGTPVADRKGCYIVSGAADVTDEYFRPEKWYTVDPETVGQFTGLEDKNDVKIFEGDIVQADPDSVFVVKFGRCIDFTSNKPDGYQGFYLEQISHGLKMLRNDIYYWCNKGLKVIGNVFDNSDLLKYEEEQNGTEHNEEEQNEEEQNEEEKNEKD